MEIRKERNILVAYENNIKVGGFNITNGTWIGKSGNPVKSCPRCFIYDNLNGLIGSYWDHRTDNNSIFARAIKMYREVYSGEYGRIYSQTKAQRLEALISVGLYPANDRDLEDDTRLSKDVVEHVKANSYGEYSSVVVKRYMSRKAFNDLINEPDMPTWTRDLVEKLGSEDLTIPIDYYRSAIKRCAQEKVYEFAFTMNRINYEVNFIGEAIIRYYRIAMKLFGSVKVERNFLTHLSELIALEKKYEDEHYNEELNKHNNLPVLYYEDDTYIICPLLTRDAFHDEGEQQHNCVERMYMARVHDKMTHVVQVRRKADPNKALITCEVSNNGDIWQWLTFGNSNPGSEYNALKRAYQTHLKENWGK